MRRLGSRYRCTTLRENEGKTIEVVDEREADGEWWKRDIPLSYLLANHWQQGISITLPLLYIWGTTSEPRTLEVQMPRRIITGSRTRTIIHGGTVMLSMTRSRDHASWTSVGRAVLAEMGSGSAVKTTEVTTRREATMESCDVRG